LYDCLDPERDRDRGRDIGIDHDRDTAKIAIR
jgi:hypothetical protein